MTTMAPCRVAPPALDRRPGRSRGAGRSGGGTAASRTSRCDPTRRGGGSGPSARAGCRRPRGPSSTRATPRPGTFISARSRSSRSGTIASTRKKSTASPMRSSVGCRRPRRMPGPPRSRSAQAAHLPQRLRRQPAAIPADAADRRRTRRRSASRVRRSGCRRARSPPDQCGSDGIGSAGPRPTSSASAHDVVTSRSRVRASASSIAWRNERHWRGTMLAIASSCTTTSFTRLSTADGPGRPGAA